MHRHLLQLQAGALALGDIPFGVCHAGCWRCAFSARQRRMPLLPVPTWNEPVRCAPGLGTKQQADVVGRARNNLPVAEVDDAAKAPVIGDGLAERRTILDLQEGMQEDVGALVGGLAQLQATLIACEPIGVVAAMPRVAANAASKRTGSPSTWTSTNV
ncbi:hypothetical protein [Roseiflexus sp.]|uniref:hypothetical protein n=1 Tax=Roseiflexus sp. TaxID=2562120 RepID=UPI00398B05D0